MTETAVKTDLKSILPLRGLFLQETNFQIRYNAVHERGWSDSYLLRIDGTEVGYGSIKGQERNDRDTIFEFYVIPPFRKYAASLFRELISFSGSKYIECQSNDLLLSAMLNEFSRDIRSDVVLFESHSVTKYDIPNSVVRPTRAGDQIFEHTVEPLGDYVLEVEGEIVATGGFMLHYNVPFADLYMEVGKTAEGRIWNFHPARGAESLLSGGKSSRGPMPHQKLCVTRNTDEGRLKSLWIYADR